jgi:hypothetical protein
MNLEEEIEVMCPYCGAVFRTSADTSAGSYSTIEDCEVCCHPLAIAIHCHAGEIESVDVTRA